MNKIIMALLMAIAILAAASFNTAFAQCSLHEAESTDEGEIINNTCPVMGGEVDKNTPYKIEHKGKTIGFCCSGCIAEFKSDPEKYTAKIQSE